MKANQYKIKLTGETPLLLHNDNLVWAEAMEQWGKDGRNKATSKAGDDRSPAWRWIGCLYIDNDVVAMPSDNLMTVLREGGAKTPTGKKGGTFKRQTQSGIVVDQSSWPILVGGGKGIKWSEIEPLKEEDDFIKHCEAAKRLGFELFAKRARVGQAKHVRVRPLFRTWSIEGSVTVLDESITSHALKDILIFSGALSGIGDWRPSSPKSPGPFGKFTAEMEVA